jgi:pantoate--beta-alanine ligase
MIVTSDLNELRATVAQWRAGGNLAFVPTMGNLHEGHLTLVREARRLADRVAVSIFVNPMQFGADEDFDGYPRTFQRDQELLEGEGVDLLFAPTVETIYPRPPQEQTRVEVPGISNLLCGASRPGHFVGVATVVCKLFNMVQPDIALFGDKDYQQLAVIRRMTEDLNMPVRVVGIPTVRESDGLAMSSRNGYLTPEQRARAPAIFEILQQTAAAIAAGNRDFAALEREAQAKLATAGLRPDYFSVRRVSDLQPAQPDDADLVLLAAAFLGKARLIDNLKVRGTRNEERAG